MEGYPYSVDLFHAPLIAEEEALIPEVDSYSYTPEEYNEDIKTKALRDVENGKIYGIVEKQTLI